jgi:hypothetical protein
MTDYGELEQVDGGWQLRFNEEYARRFGPEAATITVADLG